VKKIKHIEFEGALLDERLSEFTYPDIVRRYSDVDLPPWSSVCKLGNPDKLWIDPKPSTITNVFRDGTYVQAKFERGFIWDKVSKIGENNALGAIIPAKFHDFCYSMHPFGSGYHGVEETNRLFWKMLRCKRIIVNGEPRKNERLNWFKARFYYRAVNSVPGHAIYQTTPLRRYWWHSRTIKFDCTRPGCWR
jgi:hypothetical protein